MSTVWSNPSTLSRIRGDPPASNPAPGPVRADPPPSGNTPRAELSSSGTPPRAEMPLPDTSARGYAVGLSVRPPIAAIVTPFGASEAFGFDFSRPPSAGTSFLFESALFFLFLLVLWVLFVGGSQKE